MTTKLQTEILVIGGGIGGLAAALALASKGRKVHVIERAAAFGEIGAGLQLAPNAMRSIDRLGLLDEVAEDAVFPRQLLMMDAATGERITAVATGHEFRARYGYSYGVTHRSDLHGHLLRACSNHPSVTLETDREVASVAELDGAARVMCKDGSSYEASLLIGADGLHSKVRRVLGDDQPPVCQEYVAFRGTVPTAKIAKTAGIDSMIGWVGPEMHLIQYPVRRGDLFNQVAVFRSPGYKADSNEWGTAEELDAKFSTMHPFVADALQTIDKDRRWTMYDRPPLGSWVRGRVVLVGDAAHPMLQYLAQGACQALEDAVCLAEMLDRFDTVESGLEAFQAARLAHTARVQLTARFFGEIAHAGGIAAMFRNAAFQRRDPADYRYFDWLYGHDPLACDPEGDAACVGWLKSFDTVRAADTSYPG